MILKYLALTGLALVCTVNSAIAQMSASSVSPAPSTAAALPAAPPDPEAMKALVQRISRGAAVSASGVLPAMTGWSTHAAPIANLSAPSATPLGWQYFHATNCSWYTDGTNNFFFVYPSEGGYLYVTNGSFSLLQALAVSCVNGYWMAVYVNSTTGSFNQTWSYPFK